MDFSNMTVKDIDKLIRKANWEDKKKIIEGCKSDERSGIKKVISRASSEMEKHDMEVQRIISMKRYEYEYFKRGAKYIAGIDEVGRGPLAGAVYASCVMLPKDCIIEYVNDSKKLTPEKREELSKIIKKEAISYGIGFCDEKMIDKINILNATYEAMKMAISKLSVRPQVILVDALRIPGIDIFQVPIIKGDSLSFSIAAASIVAKVERDNYMRMLHDKYPVYNFASNKGYGTKEHIEAIKKYGPSPVHRKSFIKGFFK